MRYVFGFLAAVGLVVLVFILIVRGFNQGEPKLQTNLVDYAKTQTVVRMVEEGEVNADQDHRSVSVVIGRASSTIDLVQGYEGHVIQNKSYPNNEDAFATFLRALQLQGFAEGDPDPEKQDSRGECPAGEVYTFEIITGSATVQKFWTTSCGGGTFKGKSAVVRQLFRAQIPDYSEVIRGTGLN